MATKFAPSSSARLVISPASATVSHLAPQASARDGCGAPLRQMHDAPLLLAGSAVTLGLRRQNGRLFYVRIQRAGKPAATSNQPQVLPQRDPWQPLLLLCVPPCRAVTGCWLPPLARRTENRPAEDRGTGGNRESAPFPVTVTGPPLVTVLRPTLPSALRGFGKVHEPASEPALALRGWWARLGTHRPGVNPGATGWFL